MIILLTSTKQYQQTACKIAGGFSFAEDLDIQIYKTSLHYGDTIYIYSTDMKQLLTTHDVTWSKGEYADGFRYKKYFTMRTAQSKCSDRSLEISRPFQAKSLDHLAEICRSGGGFYLLFFVLFIYFPTICWRGVSAGAAVSPCRISEISLHPQKIFPVSRNLMV